jgi:transcriptional regulator with GAF, ATPase, and Fis domain
MATRDGPSSAVAGSQAAPQGEPAVLTPEHLARLLDLARALSGASDHAEIAKIAAERTRALTGASATQLSGLSQRGGSLEVLALAAGDASAFRRRAHSAIRSRAPENDLVRSGGPIWIRSRREASERYPNLAAATRGPDGAAWAVLPLVADDEVSGVLTIIFDEEQRFDATTRAFLGEIATACGSALARGSLFTRAHERASASEEARVAGEVRERRSERRVEHRTRLYERERFARARAEAETAVALRAADAYVAQYEEIEADGPATRILGVFSSERSARDALRNLELARSLVMHASITSWTLDVPRPRTRVEIDLPESPG